MDIFFITSIQNELISHVNMVPHTILASPFKVGVRSEAKNHFFCMDCWFIKILKYWFNKKKKKLSCNVFHIDVDRSENDAILLFLFLICDTEGKCKRLK